MDKKSKTIAVVVLAVVVVGGAYYGINRWRQQRLANQILKEVYGVNAGLFGNITGGGGISNQMAQELAKAAAQEKVDEAREAAKTPADKYNETKATALMGEASLVVANEIGPAMKAVFGETKIISYGTGGMMGQSGSFNVSFKVPRVVTAEDLNGLSSELKNKGYAIMSNSVESDSGNVMLVKGEESTILISYNENGENQKIEVLYWKLSAE